MLYHYYFLLIQAKINDINNNILKNKLFINEWKINYILPFKPSSIWKLLFIRIVQNCYGEEYYKKIMLNQYYWMNGFFIHYQKNNINFKEETFISLQFQSQSSKNDYYSMKI